MMGCRSRLNEKQPGRSGRLNVSRRGRMLRTFQHVGFALRTPNSSSCLAGESEPRPLRLPWKALMTHNVIHSTDGSEESTSIPIDNNLDVALSLLRHAYDCVQDAHAAPWDFALEIGKLYEAGMTITDLRWLVVKGLVEHGGETSAYGDKHRSFTRSDGFNFLTTTCVVLTEKGAALARRVLQISAAAKAAEETLAKDHKAAAESEILSANGQSHFQATLKPRWDPARRELSLGGRIVKRFMVPARNQESILSVFQQAGWPEHIDDPLIRDHDVVPKTRLNDVIYRLNRTQRKPSIRFRASGNGNGVNWSLCEPKPMRQHPSAAQARIAAV
jgi:hypothetical protein